MSESPSRQQAKVSSAGQRTVGAWETLGDCLLVGSGLVAFLFFLWALWATA